MTDQAEDHIPKKQRILDKAIELTVRGVGLNEITKQIRAECDPGFTRSRLMNVKSSPEFNIGVLNVSLALIKQGELTAKGLLAANAHIFANCLIEAGKNNDVKASIAAINILSDKEGEGEQKQAQAINITLASDTPPKTTP